METIITKGQVCIFPERDTESSDMTHMEDHMFNRNIYENLLNQFRRIFKHNRQCSIAHVKLELAAIRFWHDKISERRYDKLPTNKQLDLKKRQYGGIDRTWSKLEFARMIAKALQLGHDIFFDVLHIARYQAFRIEECFKLDTAMANKATRTGMVTIRGKGGLYREVALHPNIKVIFENQLKVTPSSLCRRSSRPTRP